MSVAWKVKFRFIKKLKTKASDIDKVLAIGKGNFRKKKTLTKKMSIKKLKPPTTQKNKNLDNTLFMIINQAHSLLNVFSLYN